MVEPGRVTEQVEFLDRWARPVGIIVIAAAPSEGVDPLVRLPRYEAVEYGEHEVQLLEGCVYEYAVETEPGFAIDASNRLIKPALLGEHRAQRGRIETGTFTGSLQLDLLDTTGFAAGSASVEVRSSKLGYRDEYREMLKELAQRAVDLLVYLEAPTQISLSSVLERDPESLQQRFTVLRSILRDDVPDAMDQIFANPHSRLVQADLRQRVGQGLRPTRSLGRQIAMNRPRRPVPIGHPLGERLAPEGGLTTVPTHINRTHHIETGDTPENQFIKHALNTYEEFLARFEAQTHKRSKSGHSPFAAQKVAPLRRRIQEYLQAPMWSDVSDPTVLAFGSPVLQRRSGYREMLQLWLSFNALLALAWDGGEQAFRGGTRDLAALYEYWTLFFLVDAVSQLDPRVASAFGKTELLRMENDGYRLVLKTGNLLEFDAFVQIGATDYGIQLAYNRTFQSTGVETIESPSGIRFGSSTSVRGSWTRAMRPDFTFSVWPSALRLIDAERDGKVVHVHFDAKYRVDRLAEIFGDADEDLDVLDRAEQAGDYRRGDLLKMHAYRDAIRRSEGAYVLYPGSWVGHEYAYTLFSRDYHELLPGLGAFIARPGNHRDACVDVVASFLRDVAFEAAQRFGP